ncbi:MAG TPA: response regulator [Bacteroidota bacterium]|nr:response regulator [Bacteroidota bacterium]
MEETVINVLLVDDDANYVAIVKQLLTRFQKYRFETQWEQEGEKVISRLRANPSINLVLMDFFLPDMNGLEIAKRIANEKIEVPIVFLTANRDYRSAVEAMKDGAEEYLLKEEIRDTTLPRTIVNVLERWRLKRQILEAEKQKMLVQKKTEAIKELVVTMCHEFNNPLAAIKISTAILNRQNTGEEERGLLDKFNRSVTTLEQEIIKLRDLNYEDK